MCRLPKRYAKMKIYKKGKYEYERRKNSRTYGRAEEGTGT